MRYHADEDPKKPQPVKALRKGDNVHEAVESGPRGLKDDARDFHRHVHRC